MATTSQLLTWIENTKHGWTREGSRGSRAVLNEAHRMLLYNEIEQRLIVDPNTGDFPFGPTTDGVYQYSLPANCSILKAILVDIDSEIDENFFKEEFRANGKRYYRLLNINSREATNTENAVVNFIGVNPGSHEELYRIYYYEAPVNITSDNVQHQMPGTADVEFLMPATIKLIEGIDHGNIIEARQYIYEVLKPQFNQMINRGEQGTTIFCKKRSF